MKKNIDLCAYQLNSWWVTKSMQEKKKTKKKQQFPFLI